MITENLEDLEDIDELSILEEFEDLDEVFENNDNNDNDIDFPFVQCDTCKRVTYYRCAICESYRPIEDRSYSFTALGLKKKYKEDQ